MIDILPQTMRLSDAELRVLRSAGVTVDVAQSGHFTARLGAVLWDSRTVIGNYDPIAFTLRAIATHIRLAACQVYGVADRAEERFLEHCVIARYTQGNTQ